MATMLKVIKRINGLDVNVIDVEELTNEELLEIFYKTKEWYNAGSKQLQLSELAQFVLSKMN